MMGEGAGLRLMFNLPNNANYSRYNSDDVVQSSQSKVNKNTGDINLKQFIDSYSLFIEGYMLIRHFYFHFMDDICDIGKLLRKYDRESIHC